MYKQFINENYDIINEIIDGMNIGIWITDEKGIVLMINQMCVETGGYPKEEVVGKTTEELLEDGYILEESSVLNAIGTGEKASIIQGIGIGGNILATSVPLYVDGKIDIVVCVENNITDVVKLKKLLAVQEQEQEQLRMELDGIKELLYYDETIDDEMIAESPNMLRIIQAIKDMGTIDSTVLITGESGVGKEVVTNMIVRYSKRADKPLIKINCSAIPETLMESEFFGYEKGAFTGAEKQGKAGLFELADKGTIFLDEIGEIPLTMQGKLLRTIQEGTIRRIGSDCEKEIDVRIIAATNRNLKNEMQEGRFRQDLYYRLNVLPLEIPPLRKRREDIEPLARHFIKKFNEKYSIHKKITQSAIYELEKYDWPGNVRELSNIVERMALNSYSKVISGMQVKRVLTAENSESSVNEEPNNWDKSLSDLMGEYEKQILMSVLEESSSATQAAKKLGIDKSTMLRKIKKYNITQKREWKVQDR